MGRGRLGGTRAVVVEARARVGVERQERWPPWSPKSVGLLAGIGATLGTAVDGLHNQVLLTYAVLPVAVDTNVGSLRTSLVVPPLLAIAYAVLGEAAPRVAAAALGAGAERSVGPGAALDAGPRAVAAVLSTAALVRLSAFAPALFGDDALAVLAACAGVQWFLIDGTLAGLAVGLAAGALGPLAELPLIAAGWWSYIAPDYLPLGTPALGLSALTAPCYFAVATDAAAIARWCRRTCS